MNDSTMLEQRLKRLGQELSGDADLVETVMRRLASEGRVIGQPVAMERQRQRWLRWQGLAAMAACFFVCFAVWWVSRPTTLYARMLAALDKAQTVHASGWTRQIVRKWPLEKPFAGDQSNSGKQAAEFWYWRDATGEPCSYEQVGPVVVVRRGGNLTEYQRDADLMYKLVGGYKKDRIAQFERLAEYLAALNRPSLKKEELGTRDENGRSLRGLRFTEGTTVEEIWFDARTDLPARLSRFAKLGSEKISELVFTIDEPVPAAIAKYEPPKTKYVRGGSVDERRQAWLDHVAAIEDGLLVKPIAGRFGVVLREDGRTFDLQYPQPTPSGKYWVVPLDISKNSKLSLADFVRFHAASGDGERRAGTWRVPKKLHDMEFARADLVYEDGVPWQDWVQFALGQFGLEFVDVTEERTVWVAKQDGRKLKDWHEVKPPVPYVVQGGIEKKGIVRPGIGHLLRPVTMGDLIDDFNTMIDRELAADKPWIIDETDLPAPPKFDESVHGTPMEYWRNVVEPKYLVSTDAPYFVGKESLEIARNWYAAEFGITFHEERRMVTVHVVRRKK